MQNDINSSDKVIWRLQRRKSLLAIYSHITYFSVLGLFLYILIAYSHRIDSFSSFLAFFCIFIFMLYVAREFYYSLNLKTIYLSTDNNIYIKKYLGRDIIMPLGSFIFFHRITIQGNIMGIGDYSIEAIDNHSFFPIYFFLESANTNVSEIQSLIKPYIIDYLLKCNEKAYNKFKVFYSDSSIKCQYDIDYKEIDKLREEAKNG